MAPPLASSLFATAVHLAPCPDDIPHQPVPAPTGEAPRWADPARVREPEPRVSLGWLLFQLVPSPELVLGSRGAAFGARWQLTPFSYSFGTDPRLDRFRFFLIEPLVRQSGSLELFVSPEYLAIERRFAARFGGRAGLRSYFGVLERGDYLSLSLGSSYYRFAGEHGVTYEAGVYVLFGFLGLQVGYSPAFERARVVSTLAVRVF